MSGLTGAGADDALAAATIRAALDQGVDLITPLASTVWPALERSRYLLSDKFTASGRAMTGA